MKNDPFAPVPKKVGVYNPLAYDFSVEYDTLGNAEPKTYTVRSQEIAYFKPHLAEHIKKHLLDEVTNDRGASPLDQLVKQEILDEIKV
jgi:hypothetical protein